MKQDKTPLVSICVIVYNHAKYVLECLKSIAAQRCPFEFEVVIRDDASVDGSEAMVADFIQKNELGNFRVYRAEKNEGMMPNLLNALRLCKGDYIAFCEGDDYWTDNTKLEKQISLMQANPGCAISVHPCYLHRSAFNKKCLGFNKGDKVKHFAISDILTNPGQSSPSSSYVFVRRVVDVLPEWLSGAPVGDFFIEMYSMTLGFGLYMPNVMSAYRVRSLNSWSDLMQKKNGRRLIQYGAEMNKCIQYMENEIAFKGADFRLLKSSISLSIAIGHLLEHDLDNFRRSISESQTLCPDSTRTQHWLYTLKELPTLALFLYNSKKMLDRYSPVRVF